MNTTAPTTTGTITLRVDGERHTPHERPRRGPAIPPTGVTARSDATATASGEVGVRPMPGVRARGRFSGAWHTTGVRQAPGVEARDAEARNPRTRGADVPDAEVRGA
ncbi:hypothetical protein PV682_04545 [Streptomyces niveiscabiei]|uniref:hypothetical protein n=1 Tax=Streptomyces niveiscabiei TaxID=164115 RepID=UPI0029B57F06|nr:hypothetical protein [Streptomyces niveiscabiei]MDX3380715.1 hypothetical protein [Streptomyces niveiscabiei]